MEYLGTSFGLYVFIVIGLFFLIQFLLTIIGAECNTDFDADTGFDFSDWVSFKGISNFCLGFSLIWAINGINTINGIIAAAVTGLLFIIMLGWLYKMIYTKLTNEVKPESLDSLIGRPAKIYLMLDNQRAIIKTEINGAEREIDATFVFPFNGENNYPNVGDHVNIIRTKDSMLIIDMPVTE